MKSLKINTKHRESYVHKTVITTQVNFFFLPATYSTGQKYGLTFFRFLKLLYKLNQWVKNVRSVLKMFGQHS